MFGRKTTRYGTVQWTLAVSFLAAICSFILSIALTATATQGVGQKARDIQRDAVPSVQHLVAARSALRELELSLLQSASDGARRTRPQTLADIKRTSAVMSGEIAAYLALPAFPGEQELQDSMRTREESALSIVETVAAPDGSVAVGGQEIRSACKDLDRVIVAAIRFNAHEGSSQAHHIEDIWTKGVRARTALTILSVILSTVVAAFAVRAVGKYGRALEERADELEQFAGRVAHDIRNPVSAVRLSLEVFRHPRTSLKLSNAASRRSIVRTESSRRCCASRGRAHGRRRTPALP